MRYSVALGRCVRNSGEDATPTVCKNCWLLVQSYLCAELSQCRVILQDLPSQSLSCTTSNCLPSM